MTSELLSNLLIRSELGTLDFKLEPYDFGAQTPEEKNRKRSEFAKDIISMANTPRDESAFIVIGVKRRLDGTNELKGITLHIDDNLLQQQIEGLVYPHPRFQYEQISLQGLQFGVIEIFADRTIGPFLPQLDTVGPGCMRRNVLYWRRGSKNAEASPAEQKAIHGWFRAESRSLPKNVGGEEDWERFVQMADVTEPGRQYLLILAPHTTGDQDALKHLAWVDWNLVIDLDPGSESTGVLSRCKEVLDSRRTTYYLTKSDDIAGSTTRATYWYFCRGINGRAQSLSTGTYPEWNKSYSEDLRKKLIKFAAGSSDPLVLIAFWSSPEKEPFVRRLIEACAAIFGARLVSVIVTEDRNLCERVAIETDSAVCEIQTRHFLEGLSTLQAFSTSGPNNVICLPGLNGVPKEVPSSDLNWLEEDLEIVHLNIGQRLPNDVDPDRDFLRGGSITWFGVGFGADVEREKLSGVLNCIRRDLESRKVHRVNVLHRPGAGGSTFAMRLLWSVRKDYPCVVLKRCVGKESVERLARIYALCEKPVLVLREGAVVSDSDADLLAELLAARKIPSVMLQVVRRYSDEPEAVRRYFLSDKLTAAEASRFSLKLAAAAPDRVQELKRLAASSGIDRTPFIFGLTAFADDFRGLRPFVKSHLIGVTGPQRKVLLFLAIAHAYGQQVIGEQHFAELLGIPLAKRVELCRALSPQVLGLLAESERGYWRTRHNLVAKEILTILLSEGLLDERNWTTRLADVAREFADFCRSGLPVCPDDLQASVERVFFFRNDSGILGSSSAGDNLFSELIGDIPSPEGRLGVFLRIVELFPENAHYWAHLGRYYAIRLHQFDEAIRAIDKAIEISPRDNALHHMKGMAIRNLVYERISAGVPLPTIVNSAKQASVCFAEARALAPDEDHGYISEAQMITRLLEYAQRSSGLDAVTVAATPAVDPWMREGFQQIEDLLLAVRRRHVGEQVSEYEERCRAELDALYGAHDQALQRWQNLLERRDGNGQCLVHAPAIRRQIVWARLAQCGRRWDRMQGNRLQRAVALLEENLQEEPSDDRNVRLWIQGARFLPNPPTIEAAAERVAYWRANGDSMESVYYSYALQAVQAIGGSRLAGDRATRLLEECRNRARYRRDRTRSFEWLGSGSGLRQLVHQDMLGEWSRDLDFWRSTDQLRRVGGVVASISGPHAGEIEVEGGLKAFFVPGVTGLTYGRDQNARVTLFLGFSYEGLRAWSVSRA